MSSGKLDRTRLSYTFSTSELNENNAILILQKFGGDNNKMVAQVGNSG